MTRPFLLGTLVAILAIAHGSQCQAGNEDDALIEQMRQSWKKREAACRSFVAEWTQEVTHPAGTRVYGKDPKPFPPKDRVTQVKFRFVCDGQRAKLTRAGLEYDLDRLDYLDKSYTRAFDGKTRRELFESKKWGSHPAGSVRDKGEFYVSDGDWRIHPLIATFRPGSPNWGALNLSAATLLTRMATVSGVKCHVLEVFRYGGSDERFYFASSPDFRLIRREIISRNVVMRQLTIDYEPHPSLGHVCKSWTLVERISGAGNITEVAVVPKLALTVNEPVEAADLAFQFAPGTVVNNDLTGDTAIVRRDGSLRTVTARDVAADSTWEKFMEPGPPPVKRSGMLGLPYLSWIGGFTAAALLTWAIARRLAHPLIALRRVMNTFFPKPAMNCVLGTIVCGTLAFSIVLVAAQRIWACTARCDGTLYFTVMIASPANSLEGMYHFTDIGGNGKTRWMSGSTTPDTEPRLTIKRMVMALDPMGPGSCTVGCYANHAEAHGMVACNNVSTIGDESDVVCYLACVKPVTGGKP